MISLGLARKSVFRRPKQNLAVIMGVALGVSLFVGVQVGTDSLSEGFVTFVEHGLGQVDAQVTPSSTTFFVTPDIIAEELGAPAGSSIHDILTSNGPHLQYIQAMAPRIQLFMTALQEETGSIEVAKRLSAIGDEDEFGELKNSNGDVLKTSSLQPGEIYLGEETARLIFKQNPIGQNLTLSTSLFSLPDLQNNSYAVPVQFILNVRVADVFQDVGKGRENFADYMVTNLAWLQNEVHNSFEALKIQYPGTNILGYGSESLTDILIKWTEEVKNNDETELASNAVQNYLSSVLGPGFSNLITVSDIRKIILDAVRASVDSIELLLNVFASLIIVAGVLVIVNIQNMALAAREKETGILRALGGKRLQIITTNLWEAVFLGVLGSIFGLFGGTLYGRLLVIFMGVAFEFPTGDIPVIVTQNAIRTSLLSGIFISLFTGLLPAISASRVNVAQVLRGLRPPTTETFGKKTLYLGFIITIYGFLNILSLDPNPIVDGSSAFSDLSDTEAIYPTFAFLILGISLLLSYYKTKKIGLTFFAVAILGWAYFNIFVVFDLLETGNGGLNYILFLILSLVAGTILLFGMNLNVVAKIGEGITALIVRNRKSPLRGTSMVAFRKMTSQATRSTLTFALFATILTLNIFIATWSYSFRFGFDSIVVELSGNTDFMLTSQPIPDSVDFSQELIDQFNDASTKAEFIRPFTFVPGLSGYVNESEDNNFVNELKELDASLVTMPAGNFWKDPNDDESEWLIKLNLQDNKTGTPYEVYETQDDDIPQTFEDENVWRALLNNETLPNRDGVEKPIIITSILAELTPTQFIETHHPGDSVYLNLTDGTLQEFIIASFTGSNPISDSVIPEGPPGLFQVWYVNEYWSEQLSGFIGYNDHSNLFLGKTNVDDITSEDIDEFIRDVEIWANQQDGEFRQEYDIYSVIGTTVYSIYEAQLEGQYRFFLFLQAFVSLGFAVGILGLLVVAARSVAERTREIGMLRALGFKRRDVVISVILELVVMGIIGLFIGLLNGTVLGYALTDINSGGDAAFLMPWPLIGLYTVVTLFSAMIAAIFPAIRASKIPPSDALRYTG